MADPEDGREARVLQDADFDGIHPWYGHLRRYLAERAHGKKLAGRRDIDPCDFVPNLQLINLVDVVREPDRLRFRFRLVGSAQSDMAGREITGLFVDDAVLPQFVDRIVANMRTVVETGRPVRDRFPMPHPNRDFIDSERVYFPLAADGETVDMILIACIYPGAERLTPRLPADRKSTSG